MMRYEKEFKSDLRFQIETLKRVLRYQRDLRLLLFLFLTIYYPIYFFIAYENCTKFGLFYGFYWALYPVIVILVPIISHLTPKTYKTHLRGIFINGHLYKWKNFSSYFVDDRFLYLTRKVGRWETIYLVLPRDFEDVVKDFVKIKTDNIVFDFTSL